jgi:cell division protein FtsL
VVRTGAERLRLSAFGRIYLAAAFVIVLGIAYLLLASQVTQSSYELNRLRADQAQLRAEQDQLKLKQASLRTPARVDQAAVAAGLQSGTAGEYVGYKPVAIDITAPIGQNPPDEQAGWQRALAALMNGLGTREASAASR